MNIKIQLDAIGVESGVQLDGQDYLGSGVTVLLVRRDPIKVVLISNETNKVLAVCSQGVNDFLVWTSFPVTPNDKPFNKPKGNDNDKVLYEFVKIPKPPISGDEMGDFIEYSTPDFKSNVFVWDGSSFKRKYKMYTSRNTTETTIKQGGPFTKNKETVATMVAYRNHWKVNKTNSQTGSATAAAADRCFPGTNIDKEVFLTVCLAVVVDMICWYLDDHVPNWRDGTKAASYHKPYMRPPKKDAKQQQEEQRRNTPVLIGRQCSFAVNLFPNGRVESDDKNKDGGCLPPTLEALHGLRPLQSRDSFKFGLLDEDGGGNTVALCFRSQTDIKIWTNEPVMADTDKACCKTSKGTELYELAHVSKTYKTGGGSGAERIHKIRMWDGTKFQERYELRVNTKTQIAEIVRTATTHVPKYANSPTPAGGEGSTIAWIQRQKEPRALKIHMLAPLRGAFTTALYDNDKPVFPICCSFVLEIIFQIYEEAEQNRLLSYDHQQASLGTQIGMAAFENLFLL